MRVVGPKGWRGYSLSYIGLGVAVDPRISHKAAFILEWGVLPRIRCLDR